MSCKTVYFREAKAIIDSNRMAKMIDQTLAGIEEDLVGSLFPGTTLKATLDDCGWRDSSDKLKIIDGRRYQHKGYWKRIAIEANLSNYEFLWEGLFRLQVGFDKGEVDVGLLILNGNRSEKSPLGESVDLVRQEVEELFPTISLPVVVALFDVGEPDRVEVNENVGAVMSQIVENDNNFNQEQLEQGVAA